MQKEFKGAKGNWVVVVNSIYRRNPPVSRAFKIIKVTKRFILVEMMVYGVMKEKRINKEKVIAIYDNEKSADMAAKKSYEYWDDTIKQIRELEANLKDQVNAISNSFDGCIE